MNGLFSVLAFDGKAWRKVGTASDRATATREADRQTVDLKIRAVAFWDHVADEVMWRGNDAYLPLDADDRLHEAVDALRAELVAANAARVKKLAAADAAEGESRQDQVGESRRGGSVYVGLRAGRGMVLEAVNGESRVEINLHEADLRALLHELEMVVNADFVGVTIVADGTGGGVDIWRHR